MSKILIKILVCKLFSANFFFRISIKIRNRISLRNVIRKGYDLYIKDTCRIWWHSTKFLSKSVKDQNFTLNFNIRTTFYTQKTTTKFGWNLVNPSKFLYLYTGPTDRKADRQTDIPIDIIQPPKQTDIHTYIQADRQRYIQTDGQTDGHFFVLFLSSKIDKIWTYDKWRFFFILAITILSLITCSVCDEKVKTYTESNWRLS